MVSAKWSRLAIALTTVGEEGSRGEVEGGKDFVFLKSNLRVCLYGACVVCCFINYFLSLHIFLL